MTMQISLTRGQFAIIDDEDRELIGTASWHAIIGWKGKTWYAKSSDEILMHRLICNVHWRTGKDNRVDHIDGNGLNNTRKNLQILTPSLHNLKLEGERSNNTSGVTGVNWHFQRKKWCAEIKFQGKKMSLGLYEKFEDAVAARKAKETEIWQRFNVH